MVLRCSFTLGLVGGACTTLTKISPDVSLKVTKRSRAGQYATQVHRKAGIYPAIFLELVMPKKILSVFIDESGDFGKLNLQSPYYYVALVLHDQSIDIAKNIHNLETHMEYLGYPQHAIHTGPIIRREQFYKTERMDSRRALFNALFHFMRKLDIHYLCPKIDKRNCQDTPLAYTAKLARVLAEELRANAEYFNSFDLIVNYYDNGQGELTKIIATVFSSLFENVELRQVRPADYKLFQVADLICTMELTKDKAEANNLSRSELEFFHSAKDFTKNLYRQLEKKKLKPSPR